MSTSDLILSENRLRCRAFCDCEFPSSVDVASCKGPIPDLVECHCGEEESDRLAWSWQQHSESDVQILNNDIIFHPTYSQGTAIVRGSKALQAGRVHFWEMRVLTVLAGTDVMFGVGTDSVNLEQFKFHFVSGLGTNSQSWGYSYNGKIQHDGVQLPYGQKFSQGCLVGIYLDRTHGRLEFFLNRRSLGVAYTNIPVDPRIKIYPMVCSTAAKSVVRLINATSQADTLQLRAFQALSKQPEKLEELRQMPGLRPIIQAYWFLAPPVRYSQRSEEHEYDILDEAVLSTSTQTRRGRKQKYRDEDTDINDLYSNAHKIAMHRNESDESEERSTTAGVHDYYDEYFHYLL